MNKKQGFIQLIAIQAGGAICLPTILIGQMIATRYGILSSIVAIVFGNLFLGILGTCVAHFSAKHRLSTGQCAEKAFGATAKLPAIQLVLTLLFWFAVQLELIAKSVHPFIPWISFSLLIMVLGVAMTLFCLMGMSGLSRLSLIALPLLLGTLLLACFGKGATFSPPSASFSPIAISLIIGSGIGAVIDLPTFFSHARSTKSAIIASLALFGVILPCIQSIGVYLGAKSSSFHLVDILSNAHPFPGWKLWVLLFLGGAGWTTNQTNLYSAVVNAKMLLPTLSWKKRSLLLGFLGTILGCFMTAERFEILLQLVGIALCSLGACLIVFMLFKRRLPLFIWALGSILGVVVAFFKAPVPSLGAFLVSFIFGTVYIMRKLCTHLAIET